MLQRLQNLFPFVLLIPYISPTTFVTNLVRDAAAPVAFTAATPVHVRGYLHLTYTLVGLSRPHATSHLLA